MGGDGCIKWDCVIVASRHGGTLPTRVRRLTDTRAFAPSWSPDGEHIVSSAIGLYVMGADGTRVTQLPTNIGETSLPDWTD